MSLKHLKEKNISAAISMTETRVSYKNHRNENGVRINIQVV